MSTSPPPGAGDHRVPPSRGRPSGRGDGTDAVLVRRDRYERLANLGQRIGYLLLAVSVVAFLVGVVTGLPTVTVALTIAGLVGACIFLPPAIIAGYAVKAADREDRDAARRPARRGRSGHGDTMP